MTMLLMPLTVLLIMMLMMMMAMATIKLGYSAPDSASRC